MQVVPPLQIPVEEDMMERDKSFQIIHSSRLSSHIHSFTSQEVIEATDPPPLYANSRHGTFSLPEQDTPVIPWRMKERMRTVGAALVLCLNIGVDPPDLIRPDPCARLECWMDPFAFPPQKALSSIGTRLQRQYERWQPRARYKMSLDQTDSDLKRLCLSLRRGAKIERVLFHYNGHGVPRPTKNGEFWAFNKNYTQYVPISVFDLVSWLGTPSVFVLDVSNAGILFDAFNALQNPDILVLAACADTETLPQNPSLPADLFTASLTTPIRTSLDWFVDRSILCQVLRQDIHKLPGRPNDRKSPFGELNWVFTAVTDTIAWTSLDPATFKNLFRQDLMVASLYRNFLLANRIMRSFHRSPQSIPSIPDTSNHQMWESWDLSCEFTLSELSKFLQNPSHVFKKTRFFSDQLAAFEVWLEDARPGDKPLQLPVVLQVLLSQTHRLKALKLLARFLDKGSWAVSLALSVGIFPYVLKLLQSPTPELRNVLVFVWAKIIALDTSCRDDLVKDMQQRYFLTHLASTETKPLQQVLCCFVLSKLCDQNPQGQAQVLDSGAMALLLRLTDAARPLVRFWGLLAIATLWTDFDKAKWVALTDKVAVKLLQCSSDRSPEVRAAVCFAIGTFLPSEEKGRLWDLQVVSELCVLVMDASPLVRTEILFLLRKLVMTQFELFAEIHRAFVEPSDSEQKLRQAILEVLSELTNDPIDFISEVAVEVLSALSLPMTKVKFESKLFKWACRILDRPLLGTDGDFWFVEGVLQGPDHEFEAFVEHSGFSGCLDEYYRLLSSKRYKKDRNLQILKDASLFLCSSEPQEPLDDQLALSSPFDQVSQIVFHPFENIIAATDNQDKIAVWDFEKGSILNTWSNTSTSRISSPRITSLVLPNSMVSPLLCSGADDGIVRIWSDFDRKNRERLVSAFRASPGLSYGKYSLRMDFQTISRRLSVAVGDKLFLWDLESEQCLQEHLVSKNAFATKSICSDWEGNVIYLGGNDGTVRFMDLRAPSEEATMICRHPGKQVHISLQRRGRDGGNLVSADSKGFLVMSDPRKPHEAARRLRVHQKNSPLSCLAVHDYAPLLATGSSKQFVNVMDLSGNIINRIRHHEGFLGQRIGAVTCLDFHPHRMLLASGGKEQFVTIYSVARNGMGRD